MNLTGRWKGTYTYGQGYPRYYIGKSDPFELDITDKDGVLSGSCIDEVVRRQAGNESYILGTFRQGQILFKKRYKFHFVLNESGALVIEDKVKSDGIDYSGRLRKKFFSGEQYFSGEWHIVSEFEDENNLTRTFTIGGTWVMSRIN